MQTAHPLIATFERAVVLTDAERAAVEALPFTKDQLKAGEGPSWAGDRPLRSFLVLEGTLSSSKTMRDGRLQITAFHIPGDLPDLLSLHLHVLDRDIGALTNCTLAFMSHADLRRLCEAHPRLAAALWRITLTDAAVSTEWLVNVAQRQAPSRMAHLFCELMARMEVVGRAERGSCQLGLTQEDLSEAMGMSIVHVNRTLQELRGQGLLSFEKGRLTIHDWAGLVRLGEFNPDYLHLRRAST